MLSAKFFSVFLAVAGTASAQMSITDVINAGSRQGKASLSSGIAQGSIFVVTGRGLGPADFQQATFPLPTSDGLGGVTIQATISGAIVDCIMVYVLPNQVAAILPSQTPLGTGTITVNNNGATATAPIKVVAAAFGIFTTNFGFGAGPAVAFNVSPDDGSMTQNSAKQSVQPGQDVVIGGTGLGAIASDETQAGVTDVPITTIQVYVGVKPATVVSAGRGTCCDGLDPSYRIPQGVAGWDVIRFTIPDGIVGCFVPVVVQIGSFVSNLATISIDPNGAACTLQLSTLPSVPGTTGQTPTGPSTGVLRLGRSTGITERAAGGLNITKTDSGGAGFLRFNNLPAGDAIAADIIYPTNVCSIGGFPGPDGTNSLNGAPVTLIPITSTNLDAGPTITVKGPSGTRTITRQIVGGSVIYSTPSLGNGTSGNYLDPGHYTVTGTGGSDVGAFTTSTDVPATPFVWTSPPNPNTPIDRSKDLTLTWTGGIPGTQVVIDGASSANGVNAAFQCAAPVSAGQITIPSFVLLNLPPSVAPLPFGQLTMLNWVVSTFTVKGLDLASIRYSEAYTVYVPLK